MTVNLYFRGLDENYVKQNQRITHLLAARVVKQLVVGGHV